MPRSRHFRARLNVTFSRDTPFLRHLGVQRWSVFIPCTCYPFASCVSELTKRVQTSRPLTKIAACHRPHEQIEERVHRSMLALFGWRAKPYNALCSAQLLCTCWQLLVGPNSDMCFFMPPATRGLDPTMSFARSRPQQGPYDNLAEYRRCIAPRSTSAFACVRPLRLVICDTSNLCGSFRK